MHAWSFAVSKSVTPWTVAHPLFIAVYRQEYWGGLPFLPPGELPNLGTEPVSPALQAGSLPRGHQGTNPDLF